MSARAAAKVVDMSDDEIVLELEENMAEAVDSLLVGDPVNGTIFLVTHTCKYCRASMETIGVGHGTYTCSKCEATRSRKIVMDRHFQSLETE